jgi:peptidoglycan biosynthesis protein MviN/MurJ (putative lipid II flippase)
MGTPGLALSFSVGCVVNLAILWWQLHRRLGSLEEGRLVHALARMSAAGLAAAAIVQLTKTVLGNAVNMQTFLGVFTQGAVAGLLGLVVYFAVAHFLGLEEARSFTGAFQRRFARLAHRRDLTCAVTMDGLGGQAEGECVITPDTPANP